MQRPLLHFHILYISAFNSMSPKYSLIKSLIFSSFMCHWDRIEVIWRKRDRAFYDFNVWKNSFRRATDAHKRKRLFCDIFIRILIFTWGFDTKNHINEFLIGHTIFLYNIVELALISTWPLLFKSNFVSPETVIIWGFLKQGSETSLCWVRNDKVHTAYMHPLPGQKKINWLSVHISC